MSNHSDPEEKFFHQLNGEERSRTHELYKSIYERYSDTSNDAIKEAVKYPLFVNAGAAVLLSSMGIRPLWAMLAFGVGVLSSGAILICLAWHRESVCNTIGQQLRLYRAGHIVEKKFLDDCKNAMSDKWRRWILIAVVLLSLISFGLGVFLSAYQQNGIPPQLHFDYGAWQNTVPA